jgi:hypothetical protein
MSILNVSLPMYTAIGGAVAAMRSRKRDRLGTVMIGAGAGLVAGMVLRRAVGGAQGSVAGMHPLHPAHPYNNGQTALNGMGATQPEPPWYKNPMWILVGVGVLGTAMNLSGGR